MNVACVNSPLILTYIASGIGSYVYGSLFLTIAFFLIVSKDALWYHHACETMSVVSL